MELSKFLEASSAFKRLEDKAKVVIGKDWDVPFFGSRKYFHIANLSVIILSSFEQERLKQIGGVVDVYAVSEDGLNRAKNLCMDYWLKGRTRFSVDDYGHLSKICSSAHIAQIKI